MFSPQGPDGLTLLPMQYCNTEGCGYRMGFEATGWGRRLQDEEWEGTSTFQGKQSRHMRTSASFYWPLGKNTIFTTLLMYLNSIIINPNDDDDGGGVVVVVMMMMIK